MCLPHCFSCLILPFLSFFYASTFLLHFFPARSSSATCLQLSLLQKFLFLFPSWYPTTYLQPFCSHNDFFFPFIREECVTPFLLTSETILTYLTWPLTRPSLWYATLEQKGMTLARPTDEKGQSSLPLLREKNGRETKRKSGAKGLWIPQHEASSSSPSWVFWE